MPGLRCTHARPGELAVRVLRSLPDSGEQAGRNPGILRRSQPTKTFCDLCGGLDRCGGRYVRLRMGPVFRARAIPGSHITRLGQVADGSAPSESTSGEDK